MAPTKIQNASSFRFELKIPFWVWIIFFRFKNYFWILAKKRKIHSGLRFSQWSATIVWGEVGNKKAREMGHVSFQWACDTRVAYLVATVANQEEEWVTASKKP